MDPTRIHGEFPAPSYRGYQEAALEQIKRVYADGNDVVLVRAPTGSEKSLLTRAIAGCAAEASQALGTPREPLYGGERTVQRSSEASRHLRVRRRRGRPSSHNHMIQDCPW